MRIDLLFLPLILLGAGCQTAAHRAAPTAPPPLSAPSLDSQEKTLRQEQQIQALIAQNEALHARVHELESAPLPQTPAQPEPPVITVIEPKAPPPAPAPTPGTLPTSVLTVLPPTVPPAVVESALMPNADGVIDLAAVHTDAKPGDEVNPFAVRSLPPDAIHEITLRVTGLIHGATPCALVNGRAIQPDEAIESLTLVQVEPEAALFRHGPHLLRVPVSAQPVRLRLAP